MEKLKQVSLLMESSRLEASYPQVFKKLTQYGYHLEECAYPDGFSLHGKVDNRRSVFRKNIVADAVDDMPPLFPSFTITAVIVDMGTVPEVGGHALVYSTQLFLGKRHNLYLEHMQGMNEVEPLEAERIFVTATLIQEPKP